MTIAAEDTRVKYTCNGILTDFDFTFKIFSEDDIAVIVTDSDGDETLLALTTDFTVEGVNGDFTNGGTVSTVKDIDGTMTAYAWSADYEITIMLAIDLEQETDLIYAGGYSSRSVETMSDRLTKICQQLAEKLGRALKFKKTSDEVDVEFPDLIPNKFIRVNSDGDGLEMGGTTAEVDEDKISNIAYGVSWDGITDVAPSKNAVYDQMEVVMDGLVSDDPYDATTWNGETDTAPSKNAVRDKIEAIGSGVSLGDEVSKTIASGEIELASTEHIIALTGQGDTQDELTAITKTGGGFLDSGGLVVLKGKAGLVYTITAENGTYLHLQADFVLNGEYDTLILIGVGSGHFLEISRANNA